MEFIQEGGPKYFVADVKVLQLRNVLIKPSLHNNITTVTDYYYNYSVVFSLVE